MKLEENRQEKLQSVLIQKKTISLLENFIKKWSVQLIPESKSEIGYLPTQKKRLSRTVIFLRILPYISTLAFLISLFWDFSGSFDLPWHQQIVSYEGILRTVSLTGLVGFLTNWLAVKMLFHPRKKRPLLGQGLIASRKEQITLMLGNKIAQEIINPHLVAEKFIDSALAEKYQKKWNQMVEKTLDKSELRNDIIDLVKHYMNTFLHSPKTKKGLEDILGQIEIEKLGSIEGRIFHIYKLVKGKERIAQEILNAVLRLNINLDQHEEQLIKILKKFTIAGGYEENGKKEKNSLLSEEMLKKIVIFLSEQIDIKQVIIDNLNRFDEIRLEKLLWGTTSNQLQYIQYLGCLLGMIAGLFSRFPYEALALSLSVGSLVWCFDIFLYNRSLKKKVSL